MSKVIPFLEMFSALGRWTELASAVEPWQITAVVLNRAQRSADIQVAGAAGAGANLVREAEETICRAYALNSVKISCVQPAPQPQQPAQAQEPVRSAPVSELQGEPKPKAEPKPEQGDPFARTEAIRRAAMERSSVRPAAHAERKSKGEAILGRAVTKRPTPMNELELDMGVVVVEGDVFAVDHKELKKRGAWVVAFDLTDYTGSIRVNKFLSDGSFFLYALHALLMLVLARCITKVFFVDSLFYTVALYFVVPCLTTAVSFGLYELLRRYTPRICAVLTGGR